MVCLLLAIGIDRRAQDICFRVAVDFAGVLLQQDELRLSLKGIEQQHSAIVGQMQAGRDLGSLGLFGAAFGFDFLVEFNRLRGGNTGGAVFFEFVSSWPIHQRVGQLLPFVALGAQVTHAVALDFPLGGKLVRAVFQDEALGKLLGRGWDWPE